LLRRQPDLNDFTVGGATVFVAPAGRGRWAAERLARPFFGRHGEPVIRITTVPLDGQAPVAGTVAFESGNGWSITEGPMAWRVSFFRDRRLPGAAFQFLEIDRSWRSAVFHLPRARTGPRAWPFFLGYPLEPILFTSLLARAEGAVVHATGVIHGGRGWVFAGTHGAGKSTIAGLLGRRPDCTVLNDDRVVVRRVEGQWRVFGTPWAGTVLKASPESAPLAGILFIRHGRATRAVRLDPTRVARAFLPRCFHPYWDRLAVDALLGATGRLAREVPCYEFPFVRDPREILGALAGARP
jgi:hypothetical protein